MNSLKQLEVKVVNIDIIKCKDGKEYCKIQGITPLTDKEKERILFGDCKTIEIFEEFCAEFEEICGNAKNVRSILFSGYYENFKFKPVTIVKVTTK